MMVLGLCAAAPAAALPAECLVRFAVAGATGDPDAPVAVCRDGDAACDRDGVEDGTCRIAVAVCGGEPPCPEPDPARTRLRGKGIRPSETPAASEAPAGATCGEAVEVAIDRRGRARRRRVLRASAHAVAGGARDRDRLRLVCEGSPAPRAVVVTTDFETGVLVRGSVAAPARLRRTPATIHADAVVRVAGGSVFVVNRYLGDNLQVLGEGFATRLQCSTGVGSNPHDVAVAAPDKAYVTRYDRDALWVVDPQAGGCGTFRRGTIDLGALADGDGLPEMSQMALAGDRLFVALQRLDRRQGFEPTGPSWLAVIDPATDAVVGTVVLQGHNAFADASGLQREPGTGKLLVLQAGNVYRTGDGGIERVDPEALASEGFVVTEDALGGSVTDFVVASPRRGYAIVLDESLRNLLVAFDPATGAFLGRVFASQQFLSDVALAPDGTVWLADRTLPRPGLRIFDAATGAQRTRGVVDTGLPPFSLGFLP